MAVTDKLESTSRNKRIAKNTIFLYFRMLFKMCVRLYTSRIMLDVLGLTDYGVYNVIGGLVGLFTVFSGSLSISISRFLALLVGKNEKYQTHVVFCSSIIVLMAMAIFLAVSIDVTGLWFLENKMVIPLERMSAAYWVLHFTALTFIIKLMSIPYNAMIIAHEKMSAFAYISIIEIVLTLAITYALYISPVDKLSLYAALIALLSFGIRLVYLNYCHRHFDEARFEFILDKRQLKKMSEFIGWAFWGNSMLIIRDHGTNILLNVFCGPIVNAARGVAVHVDKAVYGFVTSFLMAVHPQITKSYSSGDLKRMHQLIIRSAKFAFFIMLLMVMPLYANIHYVLNLWLVDVPAHTESFVILILLYSLVNCFFHPLFVSILAQGDLRNYEIVYSVLLILNIAISFAILKNGMSPEWCFVGNIVINIMVVIEQLYYTRLKIQFPIINFIKDNLVKTIPIFLLSLVFIYNAPVRNCDSFPIFIIDSFMIMAFIGICIALFGITKSERLFVWNMIRMKLSYLNF